MYREVRMVVIVEVLRLWRDGVAKKRIAACLGLDPKTVRRYVAVAEATGVRREVGAISEGRLRDVLLALHPSGGRPRSDGWERCRAQQDTIRRWLDQGIRLTKIRKLLALQGVELPHPMLYRFAGCRARIRPDGTDDTGRRREPGEELQLATGWVAT